ncbi:MAG: aldehyde dehydrogenase family protein [Microbacterium sp.]
MTNDLRLFIDGRWRPAGDGGTRPLIDPATGRESGRAAEATADDVDSAVRAAARAFEDDAWALLLPARRARLLLDVADAIEARADEFAQLETSDLGQPRWATGFSVAATAEHFRYFAGWVTKLTGDSAPLSTPDVFQRSLRRPLGVAALITPWNFPVQIASWKLAPALATGNTVVLKPAEQTPRSTLLLAEVLAEVGFPAGVVNVVTGGPAVGDALVRHDGVAKISFTGSVEVGRRIGAVAGARLVPVSLELGGKTPSIVTANADLDQAVAGHVGGGLYNTGQTCAAFSRVYVHESIADEFVERVGAAYGAVAFGAPETEGVFAGPLISAEHRARVDDYVRRGIAAGARVVVGATPASPVGHEEGFYYEATVLTDVADDNVVAREEIFGPVLSVLRYRDEAEAIRRANASPYALAAAVWSRDVAEANRIAQGIRAGTVWINTGPVLDAAAPWGGFGDSGLGRESGWDALLAYTGVQSIITGLR